MKAICISIFVLLSVAGFAQDNNKLVLTDDAKYFDFWEGTWYVMNVDGTMDTASYFKVRRSVHPAAFEEEWQFGADNKTLKSVRYAHGTRAIVNGVLFG